MPELLPCCKRCGYPMAQHGEHRGPAGPYPICPGPARAERAAARKEAAEANVNPAPLETYPKAPSNEQHLILEKGELMKTIAEHAAVLQAATQRGDLACGRVSALLIQAEALRDNLAHLRSQLQSPMITPEHLPEV